VCKGFSGSVKKPLRPTQEADFQPVVEPFHTAALLGQLYTGANMGLKSVKNALAQQGKGRSTVHHPFDELDFRDLTFDLSITNGKG